MFMWKSLPPKVNFTKSSEPLIVSNMKWMEKPKIIKFDFIENQTYLAKFWN